MLMPDSAANHPVVSVIVPARNEEASLGNCLQSLVAQEGLSFEIIVVDDGSTDRTLEIAQSFAGVRVIDAGALPPGWTGKNNAVWSGSKQARGQWLLFTDADTVHAPGSLARSIAEAQQHHVTWLSYSPEQEVHGLWEKAVMPVIFAELAATYRPSQVSDLAFPAAAANGQYLLVSREAYDAVGGHAAIATSLLEDVALARAVKASGRRILFRYGRDRVSARMYRSFAQLQEGWTKNLALLFTSPFRLAVLRLMEFVLIVSGATVAAVDASLGHPRTAIVAGGVTVVLAAFFLKRIRRAHFSWDADILSLIGLPLFSYLLLRSRLFYKRGNVTWKGRSYAAGTTREHPWAQGKGTALEAVSKLRTVQEQWSVRPELAARRRQNEAHGISRGQKVENEPAPEERKNNCCTDSSAAPKARPD